MSELKPCPFCGGEAGEEMGQKGDGTPWPYIACIDCGAMSEVEDWNTRTDARADRLEKLLKEARPFIQHCDDCGSYRDNDVVPMLKRIDAELDA